MTRAIQSVSRSLKSFLDKGQPLSGFATIILAIAAALWGATIWIEDRAHKAVLNESFLRTLAGRVRPSLIVTTHNSIEVEHGAEDYIENVQVIPSPTVSGYDIVIKAKRHLAYPPLLTALNVSLYPQVVERLDRHNWKVTMTPQMTFLPLTAGSGMDTNVVYKFLIEILH